MDGHTRIDGRSERTGPPVLNDAALDREIESILATEPSAEFLARVRARVADEPVPGVWRAPWMFAMAGTLAVAIVALAVWPSPEVTPKSNATAEPPRVADSARTVPAPPAAVAQTPRLPPSSPRSVTIAVERTRRIDIDLPDVVIADNEVNAYTALVARIRRSRFDAAVPALPNPDAPLEIRELPPVEPLEIEPIVKLAALQAEGERP